MKLSSGIFCGWKHPKHVCHPLLLPSVNWQVAALEVEQQSLEPLLQEDVTISPIAPKRSPIIVLTFFSNIWNVINKFPTQVFDIISSNMKIIHINILRHYLLIKTAHIREHLSKLQSYWNKPFEKKHNVSRTIRKVLKAMVALLNGASGNILRCS